MFNSPLPEQSILEIVSAVDLQFENCTFGKIIRIIRINKIIIIKSFKTFPYGIVI
jgi:hypothetical protein